jgi:hypothetical protein
MTDDAARLAGMVTVTELARLGGLARAKKLTPERRTEIARKAGKAGGKARAKTLSASNREQIARQGARTRWAKRGHPPEGSGLTHAQLMRRWHREHPEARQAQNMLNHAVRTGTIVRPLTCSACGANRKLHAHHADYSKPLDVVWLCVGCHRKLHDFSP